MSVIARNFNIAIPASHKPVMPANHKSVMPAQAGIQAFLRFFLDASLRWHDRFVRRRDSNMPWLVHAMTIFLFTLLTSCGFHLQREVQLAPPLHRMYLQAPDPYSHLIRNLRDYLHMSKVLLVASPQDADTILVILSDTASQHLLSVSGTQQTRQYRLKVVAEFEITNNKGRVLLGPQTLSEERTLTTQSNQILGSSNETQLLYQQMRRALAYAIMNRLASREVTSAITKPEPKTS